MDQLRQVPVVLNNVYAFHSANIGYTCDVSRSLPVPSCSMPYYKTTVSTMLYPSQPAICGLIATIT